MKETKNQYFQFVSGREKESWGGGRLKVHQNSVYMFSQITKSEKETEEKKKKFFSYNPHPQKKIPLI